MHDYEQARRALFKRVQLSEINVLFYFIYILFERKKIN